MSFTRLNQADGTFCLVQAPTLAIAPLVRAYHLELLSLVQQFEYWYLEAADSLLFKTHGYTYQAIANLLTPQIQAELLTSQSRHHFFVATEPVPKADPSQLLPGMSKLEQLMGFSYPDKPTPDKPGEAIALPTYVSTGDYYLDVEASLLLFRPAEAQWLREAFSPTQLSAIITYANQRSTTEDGEVSAAQQEADREFMERNQAAIDAEMEQHGVGFLI